MIRKAIATGLMALAALILAACVTVPPGPAPLDLLDYALDAAPGALEARADAGDGRAQYALSIVYRYGLKGAPRDPSRADALKRKALAQRGYTPITQYIAGLNGKPGRTAIINIPRYDVTGYETAGSDRCAAALDSGAETPANVDACNGQDSFLSLRARWAGAKGG